MKDDIGIDWIMNQVIMKFGSFKIENGRDTMMGSEAMYNQSTHGKLNKFLWLHMPSESITVFPLYYNLVHDSI